MREHLDKADRRISLLGLLAWMSGVVSSFALLSLFNEHPALGVAGIATIEIQLGFTMFHFHKHT